MRSRLWHTCRQSFGYSPPLAGEHIRGLERIAEARVTLMPKSVGLG